MENTRSEHEKNQIQQTNSNKYIFRNILIPNEIKKTSNSNCQTTNSEMGILESESESNLELMVCYEQKEKIK